MRPCLTLISFLVLACLCGLNAGASNIDADRLSQTYADYQGAMKEKSYNIALIAAEEAWDMSEDLYGDAKQTGDFAFNFAVLEGILARGNRSKSAEKAYDRSLALAHFHGDDAPNIIFQRQVAYGIYNKNAERLKKAKSLFTSATQQAGKHNISTGKSYAQLMKYKTALAFDKKDYDSAEISAKNAHKAYKGLNPDDAQTISTALYTLAKIQLKQEKWLEAAQKFETIYTNQDKILHKSDPLIGRAFLLKGRAISGYKDANNLAPKDLGGLTSCTGCWPNFDKKYLPNIERSQRYLFKRTAPVMPPKAKSSAFVILMYDLDSEGIPENIRILTQSHKRAFDAASVDAVKQWRATPKAGATLRQGKDLVTKMTFNLATERGNLIDFYGRAMPK